MEAEFREDQKQKSKEIADLSKEILALKTTLIGIDGQNGMRSQINGLSQDVNDIKNSLNKYFQAISDIKTQEARYDLVFASKMELRAVEEKMYQKILDLENKIEKDIEDREKQRTEDEKHRQNYGVSKKALNLSIIALLLSTILNIFL
jgi:predicted PilT family ATPase